MPRAWQPRLPLPLDLWLKPQVKVIGEATGKEANAVIGMLVLVWVTAQVKANADGILEGKSTSWVNTLVGCAGFAEAMISTGWLMNDPGGVKIPEFDSFVSKRAVKRIESTEQREDRRTRKTATPDDLPGVCPQFVTPTPPVSVATTGKASPTLPGMKPKPAKPAAAKIEDSRFWQFWRAYPKKWNQSQAFGVWKTLSVDDALLGLILAALAWQIDCEEWTRDNGQYIPRPSNYLADRRWTDEPVRPGQPVQSGARIRSGTGGYGSKRKYGEPEAGPVHPGPQPGLFDT